MIQEFNSIISNERPEEKICIWAGIMYLSSFIGYILPFGNILIPLVLWVAKKEHNFINTQGKEIINFEITITIVIFACALLMLLNLYFMSKLFMYVFFVVLFALETFSIIFPIIGAIKMFRGTPYKIPFKIDFIS